jgi:hypothetical protein
LRQRSVALVTRDPALYGELAGFLRERRLPAVSLLPGQRIPESVAVVLTSPDEAGEISHPHVLVVAENGDRRALAAAIEHAIELGAPEGDLVVGIDPGPRPGYAVFAGQTCLAEGILETPEAAGPFASQLRHRFGSRHVLFRVGSGDPPSRNRVVNTLLTHHRSVEIVDEQGTTPRGHRRPRDAVAARSIARGVGRTVREHLPSTPTPGEIANIQRLSRERSGGQVTISRSCAGRVFHGEISMTDAVAETLATGGATSRRVGSPDPRAARRELL